MIILYGLHKELEKGTKLNLHNSIFIEFNFVVVGPIILSVYKGKIKTRKIKLQI